jgi:cold-shock DNA-binding protein family
MFKIVHLVTGVAALLLSLMPSLKPDATPFLQQPDAVYLALLGLLNLLLAPVVPLYYRGARQQLQYLACALLVVAVVVQTLTLLARPEMGNLAALVCAALAVTLHLVAGFARSSKKARASQGAPLEAGKRDTGT